MFKSKRVLPEAFFDLQRAYTMEKSLEGKLRLLGEMLELIPEGYIEFNKVRSYTTHMMRLIRDKIKRRDARDEAVRKSRMFFKSELFTIALIGDANSGKTRLLNSLCGTNHPSTLAPFETKEPLIGVFEHGGVKLRVVEVPSAFKNDFLRILNESDLIILLPGDNSHLNNLISDFQVETPVKVLDSYPNDLWGFLDLIVVSLRGELLVLFDGTTISDLDLDSAKVNGELKKADYALIDGDLISSCK